jgi:hypothetical protein
VIGYSYESGGSELLRFRLDAMGRWHRRDAWVLRSSDYYSSRNYTSRLVDGHLVMYTQSWLRLVRGQPRLPQLARWGGGRLLRAAWTDVMAATDIHRPIQPTANPTLHVVIDCDLGSDVLRCDAQGIVGPSSRSFYVSHEAVYVWIHDAALHEDELNATLYRLPFGGSGLGAVRASGIPIDQFSFKERDGMLAVVVRSTGCGDGMFGPEHPSDGALSLLRVPVSKLTAGVVDVEPDAFTPLPQPGSEHALVNRFVGDHLLYGEGDPWWFTESRTPAVLHVVRWVEPKPRTWSMAMTHGIERIEALGEHALVVGGDREDLHFSSIALARDVRVAARHVEQGAAQGETRSHGFFFAPSKEGSGILGLPVRAGEQPGWAHLVAGSSGVVYLAVDELSLGSLGALGSDPTRAEDDHCQTSCIDWYGSARPLFIDDRVFALLGYELVEGRVRQGRIEEVARADLLAVLGREPPRGK